MRMSIAAVALVALVAFAQGAIPVFIGPVINFLPPALDANGRTVAFASTVDPNGAAENTSNLYVGSTKLVPNVTSVGLTSDGSHAVFTDAVTNGEGVGTVDISTGVIHRMNVDISGCVQPLAVCAACFFSCVATPHATVDGSKVLFVVRRNQPFLLMNTDGTNLVRLPIYSGVLAPSPQRVISTSGLVVFTSSAPDGPTFSTAATDVYLMNLDGRTSET